MTAQCPDRLLYQGRHYALFANPLESFFKKHPPRPSFAAKSTANWRGYVAAWEIAGDRLFLTDFAGGVCTKAPEPGGKPSSWCNVGHRGGCSIKGIGLGDLFQSSERKVFADWFSGVLRLPHGDMVEYVHQGYGSRFERYLLVKVENGRVVGTKIVGAEQYERDRAALRGDRAQAKKAWWQFWKWKIART